MLQEIITQIVDINYKNRLRSPTVITQNENKLEKIKILYIYV